MALVDSIIALALALAEFVVFRAALQALRHL
jgi:hypothetical protein